MTDDRKVCTVALLRHGGSHLIRPIVAELGWRIIEPGNFGAPLDRAQGPVIVWLRDPRNRMISMLRFWRGFPRPKPAKLAELRRHGGDDLDAQLAWLIAGQMPEMLRWARIWCRRPTSDSRGSLSARFEDVVAGAGEIGRIATFLGAECDATALRARCFGNSRTCSGNYSDWRREPAFGPLSRAAWAAGGGAELIGLMGYDD